MKWIIKLLVQSIAVFVASYLTPGVKLDSYLTAVVVAVVFGFINTVVRPVLALLTLPINILSFGLFTFVLNTFVVYLVDMLVSGFKVENLLSALIFSIILSLVSWFLDLLSKENK